MLKKIIQKFIKNESFKIIGKNVHIMKGNEFTDKSNISIGNDVYIGPNNKLYGQGGIEIGDGSILAFDILIMTRNHNYDDEYLSAIPYDSKYIHRPVIIEENVWIGSRVSITPGVTIGEGSVIAMGSVVTKDVPKCSVVGGNPAKVLKYRDIDKYNELKSENRIYLKKKYW